MQYVNLYKIKKVIQAKMPFYTVFFPLVGKPFDDPEQVTFLKGRKLVTHLQQNITKQAQN
jgi:hypothetical protein